MLELKQNRVTHRYFAPKKHKEISEKKLKYSDAKKLANDINFNENQRYHVLINGTFFFGDFIEAFIVENNIHVKKMTISTLSMNKNNVDSLENLLKGNYIDELNLILSDFFFGHEKNDLVPYIYEKLDHENKFQVAFAGTHCKLCILESHSGRFYVFHGSANLRSSSNIEQICLEENKDLYLWMDEFQTSILNEYKTINKSVRGNKLWQILEKVEDVQDVQQIQELDKETLKESQAEVEQQVKRKQELHFKKIKF
jgi:hypothetical protein